MEKETKRRYRKNIKALYAVLGRATAVKKFPEGTTLMDLMHRYNLCGLTIFINGQLKPYNYALREGDVIVAVPLVEGG